MKNNRLLVCAIAALIVVLPTSSNADTLDKSAASGASAAPPSSQWTRHGWLGVSLGRGRIDREASLHLIDSGTVDESSTGYKIFAGYQLHKNFAAEVEYIDVGKLSYDGSFAGTPVTGGEMKLKGANVSGVVVLPANERFAMFLKAGIFIWRADAKDNFGGTDFSAKTKGHNGSLGAGFTYNLRPSVAVRLEIQGFNFGADQATLVTGGIAYRF